jgi:hypothetical protein
MIGTLPKLMIPAGLVCVLLAGQIRSQKVSQANSDADERELLKEFKGKVKPADELLKAYAGFVRTVRKTATEEALQKHCLPESVRITEEERAGKPDYGEGINLPFLKTGFRPEIRKLEKLDEDCYIIRTASSIIWFVETETIGWKIYRYHDAPL